MKPQHSFKKHELMTKLTLLSYFLFLIFPASFLLKNISVFFPIITTYFWIMSVWLYFLVRQQDPGIVPRIEILKGVGRVWAWRFHDKIKLIEGNKKESQRELDETQDSLREFAEDGEQNSRDEPQEEMLFRAKI